LIELNLFLPLYFLRRFQLFKEVIQRLSHDDEAKKEMLATCRQYYRNYHRILKNIDEFEQTYDTSSSIHWYTKNTFVYKLINKALRTEDIEQLYIFRYYISDLSKQLSQEYEKLKNGKEKKIYLYRGTSCTKEKIEALKQMEGKLIASNGYWSTSRNRSCALTFTGQPNTVSVLFKIECNLQDPDDSVIFADISSLSAFPDEQEFLFDAGSVFHIGKISIEKIDDANVYVVQIKTTKEGQKVEKQYVNEYQQAMKHESPRIMLGILLKRIGKYEKSLQYFQRLLQNPGEESISRIHHRIGIALKHNNECDVALKHLRIAYDLTSKSDPSQKIHLPLILHAIGLVYKKRRKFSTALYYWNRAIRSLEKDTGDVYRNIVHQRPKPSRVESTFFRYVSSRVESSQTYSRAESSRV
jgi:tetratricopeptide (TPR) repeat protein